MSYFGHTSAVTVLFVSYGRDDAALAAAVRDGLVAAGYEDVYLDVDADHGMVAGQHWQAELWSQVQRADAVIFLSSRASNRSRWCFTEVTLAQLAGRPVLPVLVEDDDLGWLAGTQHIPVSVGLPEVVRRLTAALRRHGLGVERAGGWDRSRPPYPGLVPFAAADAAVFYGRDELIARVAGHLELGGVSLVGPSGSGKSSLLRAGVLPRMARQADRWIVLPPVTPPSLPAFPVDDRRVLVAVDQAEELVTRCTETERRDFLQALRSATATGRVRVVSTIRSEFLPATPEMGELAGLTDVAVLVGPLTRDRLPEAIEGPARKAGLSFDSGLVARMAGDTVGGDALPLLGYLLNRLVERAAHRITVADYEAAGGVVGALRQQADMVMERLTGPVLPTLLRLVTIHEDGEATGRRISRQSLTAAESAVIDAFVEARLLVSSEDGIAVAHEALLRQWPVLGEAIAAHREKLRVRSEVERAEREWELSGRQPSYLLRGDRLTRAAGVVEAEDFLAASARQERAARIRASESLANRAGMLLHERDDLAALLALAAIEEHAPTADATQVLSDALLHLASPTVAVLVLTDGSFTTPMDITWSPDGTMIMAGGASVRLWDARTGSLVRRLPGRQCAWSPGGDRLATALGTTVTLRDAGSGQPQTVLQHDNDVLGVRWSPAGTQLASDTVDGAAVRIWDAHDGTLQHVLRQDDPESIRRAPPPRIAWSPDGSQLAVWVGGHVRCWDAAAGAAVSRHELGHSIGQVEWAPHGRRLLVRSAGLTRIWDLDPDRVAVTLRTAVGNDDDARWSPAGDLIASLNGLGYLRIWDAHDGSCRLSVRVEEESVFSRCSWSPDGTRVATPHWDGNVAVWSVPDTLARLVQRAHEMLPRHLTPAERAEYQLD